jgi:4-hydroxy-2-oxoglutarate aldolase
LEELVSHISLSGIFPPILTPFKANEEIDFDHLQSNLERWNKEPLAGYVVGGSNGEFVFLTVEERVPTMLYNVPPNTGLDLPAQAVINLATHPNIIGLKDSGGDVTKIGLMAHETRDADFQIVAGSAGFFLGALSVGAVGTVAALANIAGGKLAQLLECFKRGDLAGARAIQLPLIEANTAVTSRFGVPGLKTAMDMLGYYGGPVRSPLLPLSEADTAELRRILVKAGVLPA